MRPQQNPQQSSRDDKRRNARPSWSPESTAEELETIRDVLRFAVTELSRASARLNFRSGQQSPMGEATFLLGETLCLDAESLEALAASRLLYRERCVVLEKLHERLRTARPMAYILGATYYCGHRLAIDERALIPRSAVGTMLQDVFSIEDPDQERRILDLGTGAGGIAIAYAYQFPAASFVATDICPKALELARQNVEAHGLSDRIELIESDLFEQLGAQTFDWILCNPPYVSEDFKEVMSREYHYEPEVALFGGEAGLNIINRLLREAASHLAPGGRLVFETGELTGERLRSELPELGGEWYCHPESGTPVALMLSREELLRSFPNS